MKNVYEVLRQKEAELAKLEKEVEALRLAAPLLTEERDTLSEVPKPGTTVTVPPQQARISPVVAAQVMPPQSRAVGWDDASKRWP
jgi:hypothetical protein